MPAASTPHHETLSGTVEPMVEFGMKPACGASVTGDVAGRTIRTTARPDFEVVPSVIV